MVTCIHHSDRESAINIFGKNYCAWCRDGIMAARRLVDPNIVPNECFVTYEKGKWKPFEGTGCAHWVAHERRVRIGREGEVCLAGYSLRVSQLSVGCGKRLDLAHVRVNDIFITKIRTGPHAGLVASIKPSITIRHDSTGRHGRALAVTEFLHFRAPPT